jgi:pantetheine-phosphate adenylyltransferase
MKRISRKKSIAIYPGTFDPITYGHIDLIERGLKLFDRIIVAVAVNKAKSPLFTLHERVAMIKQSMSHHAKVEVQVLSGLVVDYARKRGVSVLIRGIRMLSDFENEFQMALTNRKLEHRIETIFMLPNESYAYLTSRLIKEITQLGGDATDYVSPYVYKALKNKFAVQTKS